MKNEIVARNYAEALFELAERSGNVEFYADLIDAVAAAVETTPRVQAVLMSPRVPKSEKARILADALQAAPREFGLFLQALVRRGRHRILREIATQYLVFLDQKLGRVRAGVTLARAPDDTQKRTIQDMLSRQMKKQVIAAYSIDPEILGGAVIRVGDRVLDGSLRRRMTKLRRQLLAR
ncbi:MAG TPA: F0F1 ATP synthase subunit delta [Gemmatimonadales bacterium]|nr:F0F1 ATP synthase subunit delta [Gemmatimonadales bacterium]